MPIFSGNSHIVKLMKMSNSFLICVVTFTILVGYRVGCMLALDKPYVASSAECGNQTNEEFCLEYGSATQLYLVPYIQHEEQVT